jgi:chromosome segregation ATPase
MTPDEAEEEFQDFIRMRGDVLEGVKNEFDQFRGLITNLHANALAKERDYASKQSELNLTRDQIVGCKRVVEDSVTAQESLDNQMNTLGEKSKKFSSTEQSDRREISNVEYNRQDLLKGLEVGADWRPDQLEQKSILEKERDFLEQKLETKQNEFSTLRTEVERGYETIVTAEKSIEEVDEEIKVLNNNVEVVEKQIRDAIRAREKKEKNIAEVRQKIVDAENDLAARRRIYKTEDTALKDLDSSLNSAKELMEGYIREFEGLNRTYKDMVNQLDKEKSAQFKVREEEEEDEET